jgi:chromosome segregation ATPase
MATVTDTDLKELKDLITAQSSQFVRVNDTLTEIKINQARTEERLSGQIAALDERLSGQIATLDEKVSGLDKRLDIIEGRVNGLTGWLIGVLFAFVGGLLGILGKITFFPNP